MQATVSVSVDPVALDPFLRRHRLSLLSFLAPLSPPNHVEIRK
jgi:hypothetical protein